MNEADRLAGYDAQPSHEDVAPSPRDQETVVSPHRHEPSAEMLEPRILLSAVSPTKLPAGTPGAAHAGNVVLIDSSLSDVSLLLSAVEPGDKVFTYNSQVQSAESVLGGVIAWAKSQGVLIGSVSILSHGAPGGFELGKSWIDGDTLAQSSSSWSQLAEFLAPSAQIDLYACNLAAPGGSGQVLINRIAHMTGASVFASTHLTGKGGGWILEAESANGKAHAADTSEVFNTTGLAAYPADLATITVTTAAAASPSPVTGKTTALSVAASDTGGNSNLIYTWSATTSPGTVTYSVNGTNAASNTTATFSKAGAYVFKCTISDSLGSTSVTSTVNVTVSQTFTAMTLTASGTAIHELQTKTLTVKGQDQFGTTMVTEPTWTWSIVSGAGSVASVNSTSGKYTAGSVAGTAVCQAANGAISKTVSVTVTNASPTVATAAAITPKPDTGSTAVLSVLGADDNGEANLTYTWAATVKPTGSNPTFSANGTNAAKSSTVTFNQSGNYTFVATINDGQGGTVTSTVTETVSQTLTSIVVTPGTATLLKNNTQQFSASGFDQFGVVMVTQPTFTWTVNGGGAGGTVGSTGLYTAPSSTGSDVVKVASGAISGTASITITNAAVPATATPSTVTGTTTSLSALSSADTGQANLTYTWTAINSPPAPVTFSVNGTNAAKSSTATFTQSGNYTIQVSINDAGTITTSSTTVAVNQKLTSIVISPASLTLNENQTQTFSASGFDQFGIAMVSQPTLTWSMDNGSVGSFNTGTLVYNSGGSAGDATIRAANGSVAASAVVSVNNAPPTVATPAAASPTTVTGLTTALSVLGADDGGESNLIYTWTATTVPSGAVPIFSDNGDNTAKNSTVTFDTAGSYTFTVTIDDGTSTVSSSVNLVVSQTLTTISLTPATAGLGPAGTQIFSATGSDQFGDPMATQPAFSWSASSGSIDQSGNYTAPQVTSTPTITASSGGVSGTASVTVTNAPPTVATAASASPSTVTATTTALSVLGTDDGGESNLTYIWAATSEPNGANPTFSANGTNAAKNTTVTFNQAGNYTFTATITDSGGLTTTSSVSVTVNQTLTTVSVSPASASLNENGTQNFAATGYDQFGMAMVTQPTFTWTDSGVGSINSSTGVYSSATTPGTATITATAASISGTANVTVTNAAPTVATAASATPSPVNGMTTALSVLGADDGGQSNLTYTWATTGTPPAAVTYSANATNAAQNTTATFTEAGTYNFQVTITDLGGMTVISSVSVTVNQTLTTVSISPATTALNENQTQQFAGVGFDQFGNAMATQPILTWTKTGIGSVDSTTGLFTSPGTSGSATITATSGSISGTANVTVTDSAPTVATPAAASPSTVTGTTTALAVLGASDVGEPNLTYTWAATSEPSGAAPTFSANGINASKNSTVTFNEAGNYTFTVTINDGQGLAVTSSVNVTVNQTLTSITVSPATAGINENATQAFSATGYDQFGNAMASQPAFNWSVLSGVGSINSSGLYLAPWATGSATIEAASGQTSGTASVTVGIPPATAPSNLTATASSSSSVALSWQNTDEFPSGDTIVRSVDGGSFSTLTTLDPTNSASIVGFDLSDGSGDAGTATLNCVPSGLGDGSLWAIGGSITITASSDTADLPLGTYALSPTSSASFNQTNSPTGAFQFDNLIYPHNNAAIGNSILTNGGLVFGNGGGIEVNVWGNGGGDYAIYAGYNSGSYPITIGSGATVPDLATFSAASTYTDSTVTSGHTYAYEVVASNGSSNSTPSSPAQVAIAKTSPVVATPAAASPTPVAGTTSALSVLGLDDSGESNLTYNWATTGTPPAAVVFSDNGDNTAKDSTATFAKAGNYTLQVTITNAWGLSTTSSVNVSVDQTLTTIAVTPASSSLNENQSQQFSAVGYDQFGNAMATEPTFAWTKSTGIGSIDNTTGLYASPGTSGSATITATSGSVSGSATVIVTDSVPTVATPAAASPSTITGTSTALSVLGASDVGEPNLTYTWAATSEPNGANPVFSDNGDNSAKNSTVTFDEAGNYTFTVTIDDGQGGTVNSSVNVTVSQTLTSITVSPPTAAINENATQAFSAVGYDQFGNAMSSQPTVTWTNSGIGSVNSSTGLYTSPGASGSATVAATSGSISGSATVSVTDSLPTVATPAAASPSTVTGTTTALSVLGASDVGEPNLTYTWAANREPNGANPVFSDNGDNSAKNSTVTFDEAGNYTFTVTIDDGQGGTVTSSVNVTVDQTLSSIAVSPDIASLNEDSTQQFAAVGYDQFGAAMATQPTLTWTKSGIGSLDASTALYTSPTASGSATVTATSGSVSGNASVTVTNAEPTVAVAASATPWPVTGTTTALSVLGADDGGEANLTYTWAASSEPNGANPTFSANGTNASKNSTVTFNEAGNYAFTVTIDDGQGGTVTSSVNFSVNQTLTSITVSPATAGINENATQAFSATGYDQFGTAMATQPTFAWTKSSGIGSVDISTGLYTSPGASGSATITATSGSISGSANVNVTDSAPTAATPATASLSTVTGTTTALSVLGASDVGEPNLTYTWAATSEPSGANPTFGDNGDNSAKNSTVTFDQAGNYTFTVTIDDGQSGTVTSSVNVTVSQTLTSITVSPATAGINENATQAFAATGYDQFGNAMATQPAFAWTKSGIGSINSSSGVYTSPGTSGSATITATSGSVSGSASVTITDSLPTVATPAAASPSTVTGTTTALSVLGASDVGEPNLTYTWAATSETNGANPIFSDNADNSAKNTTVTFDQAGNYTFTVTINDGQGGTVTSSVNVTVNQTLTSILVSPGTVGINENATQAFTATGYDQFGAAMATQPTFAWTKSSGIGSVNSGSGVYTSPGTSGSATIAATSGSVSGFATVTVTDSAPTVTTPAAASPSTVTGTTTSLSVLGASDVGEPNLTYTWAPTSEPNGANPIFSDNADNSAKNTTVTFDETGNYTFTVTINDGQGGTVTSSVNVTVNQTLTSITVNPATAGINENATQTFTATGYDQFGAAMATQPTFAWTKSGIGSVNSTTGLYTSPGTSGSATITATGGSVSGSATVTVTDSLPTVATPAAASPSTVTRTTTALSVLGASDVGEPNLTYTWAATSEPSGANPTFSDNADNSAKNTSVTFDEAGNYTFTVTIDDGQGWTVNSSVTVTVSQTLTSITVSPATAGINENATQVFSAFGYDQFGAAMATQPTLTWTNAGIGSVDGSDGLYTSPRASGTATITASNGGISGNASMTVSNAAPTVAVAASATASPVIGTATALSVFGADDGGEANLTYTWATTRAPNRANPIFTDNADNSAKNTTVTFDEAGNYMFTVTIDDGQGGTVTSSVNVNVSQTLTSITVNPTTAGINENATQAFSATGYDQFGNAMATQPAFAWTNSGIGSVDPSSGLYTSPGTSGSATIAATSGSVSGSATATVTDSAPTVATSVAASPSTVTGTTTALSVLGASDVGEPNLTYTWAATSEPNGANPIFSANGNNVSKNTTVTFNEAGNYTFTVTIDDGQGLTVTSSVNVTVDQTLTSITVNPTTAGIKENATQSFAATGYDQFGNAMAAQPAFAWQIISGNGSINANGRFIAPATAETDTVSATAGGITAAVSINIENNQNTPPTVAIPASASLADDSGTSILLSVLGADDHGESNLTYTWAVLSSPAGARPRFALNGTNAAKNTIVTLDTAGFYVFVGTISDGESTVTSSVTIAVNQVLTTLDVSPHSSSVRVNAFKQFTAAGFDQFGAMMTTQPLIRWSIASGTGSIDPNTGLYQASAANGSAIIRATSGGISGTAIATVTRGPRTLPIFSTALLHALNVLDSFATTSPAPNIVDSEASNPPITDSAQAPAAVSPAFAVRSTASVTSSISEGFSPLPATSPAASTIDVAGTSPSVLAAASPSAAGSVAPGDGNPPDIAIALGANGSGQPEARSANDQNVAGATKSAQSPASSNTRPNIGSASLAGAKPAARYGIDGSAHKNSSGETLTNSRADWPIAQEAPDEISSPSAAPMAQDMHFWQNMKPWADTGFTMGASTLLGGLLTAIKLNALRPGPLGGAPGGSSSNASSPRNKAGKK